MVSSFSLLKTINDTFLNLRVRNLREEKENYCSYGGNKQIDLIQQTNSFIYSMLAHIKQM